MSRPALFLVVLLTALAAVAASSGSAGRLDPVSALREGNRLFREGRIEEAYDAYLRGYDSSLPHAVLFYNLGTSAQHLGRLPEAILWYRRSEVLSPGDPWLGENLEIARESLGLQPHAVPGLAGQVARHTQWLYYLAALLAWAGVGFWIARNRRPATLPVLLLAGGLLVYVGTLSAERWAPEAAVLMEDCTAPGGDLPAGSEVWLLGAGGDRQRIGAGALALQCPAESVAALAVR